jgi:hypothetical protein
MVSVSSKAVVEVVVVVVEGVDGAEVVVAGVDGEEATVVVVMVVVMVGVDVVDVVGDEDDDVDVDADAVGESCIVSTGGCVPLIMFLNRSTTSTPEANNDSTRHDSDPIQLRDDTQAARPSCSTHHLTGGESERASSRAEDGVLHAGLIGGLTILVRAMFGKLYGKRQASRIRHAPAPGKV